MRWLIPSALLVALGSVARGLDADTELTILASLRPQLWYPGNDHRFGMLVPLLCAWAHTPAVAFMAQAFLTSMAAFAAMVLVARYLALPAHAATLASAAWLVLLPRAHVMEWIGPAYPNATALALGVGALLWQRPAGVWLMGLAFWVNSSIGLVLVPLWVARQGLHLSALPAQWSVELEMRRLIRDEGYWLAVVMFSQIAWALWLHSVTAEPLYFTLASPSALLTAAKRFAEYGPVWIFAVLFCLAWAPRRTLPRLILALVCALPVALNGWVAANLEAPRYFVISGVLVTLAAASALPVRLPAWALPLAVLAQFGWPTASARADLLAIAHHTAELAPCDVVAGEYWHLWPEVVALLQVRREQGDEREVYGWGVRGEWDAARVTQGMTWCEVRL